MHKLSFLIQKLKFKIQYLVQVAFTHPSPHLQIIKSTHLQIKHVL